MRSVPLGKLVSHIKGKPPSKNKNNGNIVSLLSPDYLRGKSPAEMVSFSSNQIMVENGELLLLWDGSNAGEFFQSKNGILASTMVKFDILYDSIEKPYLYFALKNYEGYLKAQTNGSGIPHVDPEILYNLEINIFSKIERQQISKILSTIDKAIEQTETLIAKYEKIKTGLMQDLLTKGIDESGKIRSEETHEFKDSPLGRIPVEWDCLTINDIAERLRSGVTPRGGTKVYQKEGVMLIRSQNVYSNGFKNNDVVFISEEINSRMKGSELKTYDVLLNITGASIGRSTFVPPYFPRSNVNQHVCSIRLKNPSIEKSVFLSSYLNSIYGQNQIFQNNAGSNREGINYSQIREIKVPCFNSDNELSGFCMIITKSTERIQKEQIKLTKFQLIKTGLMQDLLTGRVRVTKLLKNDKLEMADG